MSIEWAEMATWSPEKQRRLDWFEWHVTTCSACDLYPQDPANTRYCPDMKRFNADPSFKTEWTRVNPFPRQWVGLKRVRAVPYIYKDRWAEAPFGDRWRALKARLQAATVAAPGDGGGV